MIWGRRTFFEGIAPGQVTSALSGRVPQHIQDLPGRCTIYYTPVTAESNKFAPQSPTNAVAQTLVRLLVYRIFSTKDRANVTRPDVESGLIQFLRKHGVE